MNRHPFRWEAFLFGLVFLAVVGAWLSRSIGLVSPNQWAYVVAGGLIAVGVAGVVGSIAKPDRRTMPATSTSQPKTGPDEEPDHDDEATDAQP